MEENKIITENPTERDNEVSSVGNNYLGEDTEALEETARIQQKVEHDLTKLQAIKAYPRVFLWIMAIVWVMVLVGYDGQAAGQVISIPQFRVDFGYYYEGSYLLSSSWQSAISGTPAATMALGTFIGSWGADKFGRKPVLLLATFLTIPFVVIEFVAVTIEVFFVGKLLNGLMLGLLVSSGATYASEISPLALRAFSTSSINLALCIGPFICVLINNTTSVYTDRMAYRAIFIPQWIYAVSSLAFLPFLPESPYWLVMKGKEEKALRTLGKLYLSEAEAQRQFAIVKTTYLEAQRASANQGRFIDLFGKANIKRTFTAVMPFFMQPMSGVAYISSYSTYYYEVSGFSTAEAYRITCGAQALSIAGTIVSWFIVDRFGRRVTMLYAMISLTILNMLTAGLGVDTSNKSLITGASAFICMYNFFYNSGIGPISYVLASENPTSSLRAKTISVAIITNYGFQCLWQFVLPYMFNSDQGNMGSKINFIFGGFCALSVAYFYYYLPETMNRSFEEIDEMYYTGVPARKFKTYVCKTSVQSEQAFGNDIKTTEDHIENVDV